MPLTFMNRSGRVLPALMRDTGASVSDVVVVCDNMDLSPGDVKIKRKGTSRSHNGLASVMDALGTGDFARVYLGIGRPQRADEVIEHVLSQPPAEEEALYDRAVEAAAGAILALEEEPLDEVMNRVNARPKPG